MTSKFETDVTVIHGGLISNKMDDTDDSCIIFGVFVCYLYKSIVIV